MKAKIGQLDKNIDGWSQQVKELQDKMLKKEEAILATEALLIQEKSNNEQMQQDIEQKAKSWES